MKYRSKLDLTENVRIVEIPEVDSCACCAPHVRSTAEVGILKVIDFMPHRGGTRFTILCGRRALLDYEKKQDILISISGDYSTSYDKLSGILKKQRSELLDIKYALERKNRKLLIIEAREEAKRIAENNDDKKILILFSEDATESAARDTVNVMRDEFDGFICVFFIPQGEGNETEKKPEEGREKDLGELKKRFRYIIGGKDRDANDMQKLLKESLNARGGGKAEMVRGTVEASEEEIRRQFL